MPKLLNDEQLTEEYLRRESRIFWTLMTVNVCSPIITGCTFVAFYDHFWVTETDQPRIISDILVVFSNVNFACQIISGLILVKEVETIKRYFSKENE